jgi:hypothetical protein
MGFHWIATKLTTGDVLADLPDLQVDSVKAQIATYQTTTAVLPMASAPENWQRATLHGATVYHAVDDDTNVPVWGGFITRRPRNLGDSLSLSLATVEAYMDRRFVGDESFGDADAGTTVGQNIIVQTLVENYIATGSNGGLPIRVEIVSGGDGTQRQRTYTDISDKTIYSCLTELYAVDGGPEWTIGWEWQHNPERITPVLYVGTRLGQSPQPGLAPNAVFQSPGAVTDLELQEDYSADNAGNDFMATSTASADTRPQSDHVVIADPERPTFERRWSPSTSITDVATLNQHAQSMSVLQGGGTSTLALSAVVQSGVRLGTDWAIGDDIKYVIGGTDSAGRETVPQFPGGAEGVARAIGWQLDFGDVDVITPILQGADVDGV